MCSSISVVVPACDAAEHLPSCLRALRESSHRPQEIVVVDDGSKDDTRALAQQFAAIVPGIKVLSTKHRNGPSAARNLGAKTATGQILFFLDSDVCVHPDTLEKIRQSFDSDPHLDALIGSYDSNPSSQDFLSQYRNLMHAYVHQTGAERASTFWSGCGAIRREVFLEQSGFNEDYGRPAIEDIELGYRLVRAGRKILLDRDLLVTHLKRWTFWKLVKTDILDRGIPWTELILRDRFMPNDLNTQLSQRVSVALVFLLVALCGGLAILSHAYLIIPLVAILLIMLARWWGELGNYKRPRRAFAMLTLVLAFTALAAYFYKMYGLIPPLMVTPVLLLMKHRYSRSHELKPWHRWFNLVFVSTSLCIAAMYVPVHPLIFACFGVLLILALLNSQFYIFLAGKRGVTFMLAAIPFHLLYHFYNGLSFIAGVGRYYWAEMTVRRTDALKSERPS